jgi:hypothetical protein
LEFSTTLLREKFIIRDGRGEHISGVPVVAVSNRIVVPLHSKSGQIHETFVVRAYSMHLCVRMAAKIAQTFQRSGPLMAREQKFDFEEAWDSMTEDHESRFTPQKWIVIYNAGKPIFISGEHPAFLDMIEKCDAANPGNYDGSIHLAEDMLAKLGARSDDHARCQYRFGCFRPPRRVSLRPHFPQPQSADDVQLYG